MITKDNYVDVLLSRIPEFKAVFDEHSEDMEGEILAHPLFGVLFDFAENAYAQGNHDRLKRVIDFINDVAISGDEYLEEAAHVSFMEYIPASSIETAVLPLLSEATRTIYQTIVNWQPKAHQQPL